jgi:hypothetical protein
MSKENGSHPKLPDASGGVKMAAGIFILLVVVTPVVGLHVLLKSQWPSMPDSLLLSLGVAVLVAVLAGGLISMAITKKLNRLSALVHGAANARTIGEVKHCEKELAALGGSKEIRQVAQAILSMIASLKSPARHNPSQEQEA